MVLVANHHQFAANHHGVRTPPPAVRCCTLAPPQLTASPPPSRGGGGSRAVRQPRRSLTPPSERFSSPPLHASPSLEVDGHCAGAVQESSPRPPAPPPPPQQGSQAGRAGWWGHIYLATAPSPTLDPHGPVSFEMARAPTTSQLFPGKSSSLYMSAASTPVFAHESFFATRLAVKRF